MGLKTLLRGCDAARLAGVSRQLIRRWEELGHLTRVNGKYEAGQVLAAEALTNARSGRRARQLATCG